MQLRDADGGDQQLRTRLCRLELLSSSGLLALGLGLGVLFGPFLRPAAAILAFAGLAAHSAAVLRRHQSQRRVGEQAPWWQKSLYCSAGSCWRGSEPI